MGGINAFLESNRKPGLKIIHALRLDVKHLEAFLQLMTIQMNFGALPEIPDRLEKLFHEAGKLREFELEAKAIQSITKQNRLIKPTLFLQQLGFYEKKTSQKLRKKRKTYPAFKMRDFVKHPGVRLSSGTCHQFLAARASSILELLSQDIMSDNRSLHQLRKILKSIVYVLPVLKKEIKPVRVFLRSRKKFIQSIESKIGSLHDTDFFIRWLDKKHNLIDVTEEPALKKIKREWQNDMKLMKKNLQPLLPAVHQFALDLKDWSAGNLQTTKMVSV